MLFQQAQALHREDRLSDASSLYDQALEIEPGHGPSLHMSGMLAFQLGQTEAGLARLDRALAGGYRTTDLLDHYGTIKLRLGDVPAAIARFREGLGLDPQSGSLWFNLGIAERQAGRLEAATVAFGQAAPLLNQGFAEHALGLSLQEAGRPEEAAAAYRRALAANPADAASALNAGVIAQQSGDLPGAIALYQQALDADPALLAARINLAAALQDGGDFAAAATAYRTILAENPGSVEAMNNLGTALRNLGQTEEAGTLFHRAVTLEPFHPASSDNMTKLLIDTGLADDAVVLRRTICAAHPNDARSWLELARVLSRAGVAAQEEGALKRAVAIDPSLAEAQCRLGDRAQHRQDWPMAMAQYRLAGRLAPHRPEPQIGLALAALKSGHGAEALAACDAVLAQNRFDQAATTYRILALRQCGRSAEAEWLSDPDALVTTTDIGLAPAVLEDLAEELKAIRNRAFAPAGQSVRGGTQTQNELFAEPSPGIQAFRTALDGVLGRYLAARAVDPDHPFLSVQPERLLYHSWSVVLQAAGHHVPHIHPGGLISGVCYIGVPPLSPSDEAGCLEVGKPGFDLPLPSQPKTRLIHPTPGRLVLFPSYLWHGTRPFAGPGFRITIAFDVRHGPQPPESDRW